MKKVFLISLSLVLIVIGTMAAPANSGFALAFFTLGMGYFVYALFQKRRVS
jgi:hypothetical protein